MYDLLPDFFPHRHKLVQLFITYIAKNKLKITFDQWSQAFDFFALVKDDLSNFEQYEMSFPLLYSDFVESLQSQ